MRDDTGLNDFQAVVLVLARRDLADWDEAVGALHMVYGWMPTMLRPIPEHNLAEKSALISALQRAKAGDALGDAELDRVAHFANRSIVGASKLLHILNPAQYVIWDSRVARVFLWERVAPETYAKRERYAEYLATVHVWARDEEVRRRCAEIRQWSPHLHDSGDLRLIEMVLFRGKK